MRAFAGEQGANAVEPAGESIVNCRPKEGGISPIKKRFVAAVAIRDVVLKKALQVQRARPGARKRKKDPVHESKPASQLPAHANDFDVAHLRVEQRGAAAVENTEAVARIGLLGAAARMREEGAVTFLYPGGVQPLFVRFP